MVRRKTLVQPENGPGCICSFAVAQRSSEKTFHSIGLRQLWPMERKRSRLLWGAAPSARLGRTRTTTRPREAMKPQRHSFTHRFLQRVYFPDGGAVKLDVSEARGNLQVRWLDIARSTWQEPQTVDGGGTLELRTPGKGHWAVSAKRSAGDCSQAAALFSRSTLQSSRSTLSSGGSTGRESRSTIPLGRPPLPSSRSAGCHSGSPLRQSRSTSPSGGPDRRGRKGHNEALQHEKGRFEADMRPTGPRASRTKRPVEPVRYETDNRN